MRFGILTSVETRHQFFVRALCEHFDVAAVGYEQTGYSPATILPNELRPDEVCVVKEHFAERARQEERYLGATRPSLARGERSLDTPPPLRGGERSSPGYAGRCVKGKDHGGTEGRDGGTKARSDALRNSIPHGALNSDATLEFLESAGVETLVVYGTNLIKEPLLEHFGGRIVNMHLGLSPYYRGTATNFYPLLNEEPEYVGATIHLIDSGIDSGPIFRHARPVIVAGDRPHTIGCKAILAGIEAMIAVLREFESGQIEPVPQWKVPNARLYLRRDYHPRQVVELYRKLDGGLISRYVERADRVRNRFRLLESASRPLVGV